jgi:hypothetical protein
LKRGFLVSGDADSDSELVFSQPRYRFKPLVFPPEPIPEEELEGLSMEFARFKMRTPFGVGSIGAIERNGFRSPDELAGLYL